MTCTAASRHGANEVFCPHFWGPVLLLVLIQPLLKGDIKHLECCVVVVKMKHCCFAENS